MSKISYSYFALRRLSDGRFVEFSHSHGFIPMVSGGHNVYAPGHIVLKKSIDVPKKCDCVLSKQLSKTLQEKEKGFYSDFITNPKQETEVSKIPLPEKEVANLSEQEQEIDPSRNPKIQDERDYDLYPPIRSMEKLEKSEKLVGIGKEFLIDISSRYSKQETEDNISFKPDTHLRNDLYPPTRSAIKLPKHAWEPEPKVLKPKESESISNQCQNLGKSTDHFMDKFTKVNAPYGHKYIKSGIPSPEMEMDYYYPSTTGCESPKNPSNEPTKTIEFPKKTVEKGNESITEKSNPQGSISPNSSKFEAWIDQINPDKPILPSNFEFPKDGSFGNI